MTPTREALHSSGVNLSDYLDKHLGAENTPGIFKKAEDTDYFSTPTPPERIEGHEPALPSSHKTVDSLKAEDPAETEVHTKAESTEPTTNDTTTTTTTAPLKITTEDTDAEAPEKSNVVDELDSQKEDSHDNASEEPNEAL